MKNIMALVFVTYSLFLSLVELRAEDNCKTLKDCCAWATSKTGVKYDLGKLEKRSLKFEKNFSLDFGNPDYIFNYLLQANDFIRLKRENGFQIIQSRDLKDFQLPVVKADQIPLTLDYYSVDFPLIDKERVANAILMVKKLLSKNGRVLEVVDVPKISVHDTGFHLNVIQLVLKELNK